MKGLAKLGSRHAVPLLIVWGLVFVAALVFAPGAGRHTQPTNLEIPGTQSARAAKLGEEQFGGTLAITILLKGPKGRLRQQGPGIVRELARIKDVHVLSPWAANGAAVLSEPANQALLTLEVDRPLTKITSVTTPAVEEVVRRVVRKPLHAQVTGLAPVMRAINESSLKSLDRGELIALPILFVMLLVIFGSPLAALVPAVSGLLVTRMGTVIMGLIARRVEVDALSLSIVTMIGLALGVDYSLLMVSRFREELTAGRRGQDAVERVLARAGRTVLFAGTALSLGMVGALLVVPGALLVSAALGVIVAAGCAMLVALLGMPAGLFVVGTRIDLWRFGGGRDRSRWLVVAERGLRRPGMAALFVVVPLLLLAGPALALKIGPPNVANLARGNKARRSFEAFKQARGPGWTAPFEIDLETAGPITSRSRLRDLQELEERLSGLKGVAAVLGPAALVGPSSALRRYAAQGGASAQKLTSFERGLVRLEKGAGSLHGGLARAAKGARTLQGGLTSAAGGSRKLAEGTRRAAPQTRRLARATALSVNGARRLLRSLGRASHGTGELRQNLDRLQGLLAKQDGRADKSLSGPLEEAQSAAQGALRALGSVSEEAAGDPEVQEAKSRIDKALDRLGTAREGAADLATTVDSGGLVSRELFQQTGTLAKGLSKLQKASGELEGGLGQLLVGTRKLAAGTGRLSRGSAELAGGIERLLGEGHGAQAGAKGLAAGLRKALAGSDQIKRGISRSLGGVVEVRRGNDRDLATVEDSGTSIAGALDSGYFVLAGIEGANGQARSNASFAINTAGAGNTARVIVVPERGPFDPRGLALLKHLEGRTRAIAKKLGAKTVVGGPAVMLGDFDVQMKGRLPLLVLVLMAITFLVLLLAFRSLVLAGCAVVLNLLTVGAAVGVLILLFQGSPPLLGGAGYLDAISLSGLFAIVFGLSIDYEMFLLSRLVEGRELTGTTTGAIGYSLRKTTTIITGAAFIMAAVFLAFAVSPVADTRQFGIGLTVAVLLDATVVRLILLPALISLFGESVWKTPAWLDRVLPRVSIH